MAGGRGLDNEKGFKLIKQLADAVDGAVGASRAAVDSEWIAYSHQVGQTGKTVNPSSISPVVFPELFSMWLGCNPLKLL